MPLARPALCLVLLALLCCRALGQRPNPRILQEEVKDLMQKAQELAAPYVDQASKFVEHLAPGLNVSQLLDKAGDLAEQAAAKLGEVDVGKFVDQVAEYAPEGSKQVISTLGDLVDDVKEGRDSKLRACACKAANLVRTRLGLSPSLGSGICHGSGEASIKALNDEECKALLAPQQKAKRA